MLGPEWQIVTTPTELEQFYRAIAEGKSRQSLLVVGPTSTGKTAIARKVFKFVRPDDGEYPLEKHRHALYLDGGASPAQLYTHAYRHADRTLFIDDPTSAFVKNADGKRLWKQLFSTESEKRQVTWQTKASFLEREQLAPAFWTVSTVIAVCNEFTAMGPDIEAVKARAVCVYYNPDLATRLQYAAQWVEQETGGREIIRWLMEQFRKGLVRNIHQRHLYQALGYKRTEDEGVKTRDWKEYLSHVTQDADLEESPNATADMSLLLRWVGERTQCGVFTAANISRGIRAFHQDEQRRDAALELALKQDRIHRLPPPPRPRGSKVRMPSVVYCLGPDPKKTSLSVVTAEGDTKTTKTTKATRRKQPRRVVHA